MRESDINLLLQKAEELKALFVLGQRVIPFIEEIFIFIKETSPLLDEISASIHENLQRMPKAAKQLSKVTEATESATNEIMDTVDGLMYKSGIISTNLAQIKSAAIGNESITEDQFLRLINNSEELLKSIKQDSQGIMMSLQVQDITSQQIAAVNSIIDAVQSRLGRLTKRLEVLEFADLVRTTSVPQNQSHTTGSSVTTLHRTIAFDPDAIDSLMSNSSRQNEVDAMFSGEIPISSGTDEASSDDIDALFGAAQPSTTEPQEESTQPIPQDTLEEQSQDDIDALFNSDTTTTAATESDDPVSQDDIDALFR